MNDGETADPRTFGTAPSGFGTNAAYVKRLEDDFDAALDTVTERALDEFDFLGLPEGDELAAIVIEVNDALSAIFSEWK